MEQDQEFGLREIGDSDVGNYEFFLHVCYQCRGRHIANIGEVNQCLRQFRRILEEQKIEERKIKIHVVSVDNFLSKKADLSTLTCSQQIKLNVVDESRNWVDNRNSKIEPLIHNHFRKLKLKGTFGKSDFKISVIDTAISDEERDHRWPKDDLYRSMI